MPRTLEREPSTLGDIRAILDEVVRRLKERFGSDLVSIVLYGSYARGTAGIFPDIDLVVVLTQLPADWDALFALEHEVGLAGRGLGKKVQGQVLSRDDVRCSVEDPAPMMLEVFDAHLVLWDPAGLFRQQMAILRQRICARGIRRLAPRVWEVPVHET